MRRVYRTLLAILLVGAAGLLTATPALAHARLTSSNPAEGAGLAAPPDAISLTFAEAVTVSGDPITVTGPDGAGWTTGPATISGDTVSVPVQATGPAGAYTVAWSVISDDGDAVKGKVHFALTSAIAPTAAAAAPTESAATPSVAPAPAAAPATSDQTGSTGWPWWAWVVIALVVLAAIGLIVSRSRRSERAAR